jgi:diguanylate cyclase
VVAFVFVIGLLNLGLGFLVAVALTEPPPWSRFRPAWLDKLPRIKIPWPARRQALAARTTALPELASGTAPSRETESEPAPHKPVGYKLEELPCRWIEALGAEGIIPGSFLEAASHVMRLEVSQYREQLITAENRARASLAAADADALKVLCDDLAHFNQDWLTKQTEAASVLKRGAGGHGNYEKAAADLEQVLHDQAALIKECGETIAALHFRTEIDTGCKRIFERLFQLVDQAHALRDRLNDLLATVLRDTGGLAGVTSELQLDHATGLANRIGVELVFHDWWRDDPQRQRQASAAVIDIDRFARVNQRLGTRVGDHTLTALAQLLGETFRRDRGADRLVRLSGQSFLVFLGDTGPHQGLTAVERARQSIEATTWDDHGSEFDLTITAGITEVRREDTLADLLRRLGEALKFAKLAGRNRAALDEGDGPKLLDPPQFSVKGRVIRVGEQT